MSEGTTIIKDKYGFGKAAEAFAFAAIIGFLMGGLYFNEGINNWLTNRAKTPESISMTFNGHTARCPKLAKGTVADSGTKQVVSAGSDYYACPVVR